MRKVSLLVVLLILWGGVAGAAPDQVSGPLTLEQCEQMALSQNLSVKAADADVASAGAVVRAAHTVQMPQLTTSATYSWTGPPITFTPPGGPSLTFGLPNTYNLNATLSIPLYLGGRFEAGKGMAQGALDAAVGGLDNATDDVLFQVRQAYYGVLWAQGARDVAAERLAQAQAHLKTARDMFVAQVRPEVDVTRAEVEVRSAEYGLLAAENGVETALLTLKNVLNYPPEAPLEVAPGKPVQRVTVDGEEALAVAYSNRGDLAALEATLHLQQSTEAYEKAGDNPSLAVVAQNNWNRPTTVTASSSWNVGVRYTMPIFDGGVAKTRAARAHSDADKARAQRDQLRNLIATSVAIGLDSLTTAGKQLDVADKAVELAKESLRIANLRFQAQVGTTVEVVDAEAALVEARNNQVNAAYLYETAKAGLARQLGVPTLDGIAQPVGE